MPTDHFNNSPPKDVIIARLMKEPTIDELRRVYHHADVEAKDESTTPKMLSVHQSVRDYALTQIQVMHNREQ